MRIEVNTTCEIAKGFSIKRRKNAGTVETVATLKFDGVFTLGRADVARAWR